MRRFVQPSHVAAFAIFFAAVMVVGLGFKDWVTRASMQDVRAAVQRGPNTETGDAGTYALEGVGLPDWSRWSWQLTGGRTDLLDDDRDAITGFYRRGEASVALTVIEGTGGLDDNEPTRQVSLFPAKGPRTQLTLGGPSGGFLPSQASVTSQTTIKTGLDCTDGCAGTPLRPVLSVRRQYAGHTVVLTGWPVDDGLFRELQRMALRLDV